MASKDYAVQSGKIALDFRWTDAGMARAFQRAGRSAQDSRGTYQYVDCSSGRDTGGEVNGLYCEISN